MDDLYYRIHLWLITGLVAVVGFFLRNWMEDRKQKEKELTDEQESMYVEIMANKKELTERADAMFSKSIDKFSHAADRLDRSITGLETIVCVIKQQNIDFSRRMDEIKTTTDQHERTLGDIGVRLSSVETRCKISHGN